MALYYEMEDDIVMALNWAVRSYDLHQHKLTRQYIDLLRRRYSDRRKLKQQLPG